MVCKFIGSLPNTQTAYVLHNNSVLKLKKMNLKVINQIGNELDPLNIESMLINNENETEEMIPIDTRSETEKKILEKYKDYIITNNDIKELAKIVIQESNEARQKKKGKNTVKSANIRIIPNKKESSSIILQAIKKDPETILILCNLTNTNIDEVINNAITTPNPKLLIMSENLIMKLPQNIKHIQDIICTTFTSFSDILVLNRFKDEEANMILQSDDKENEVMAGKIIPKTKFFLEHSEEIMQADISELQGLLELNVLKETDIKQARIDTSIYQSTHNLESSYKLNLLPSFWIRSIKLDHNNNQKFKSRLVPCGNHEQFKKGNDIHRQVSTPHTMLNILYSVKESTYDFLITIDIKQAFLQATRQSSRPIYVSQPNNYKTLRKTIYDNIPNAEDVFSKTYDNDTIFEIKKPWYGLQDAGNDFSVALETLLSSCPYIKNTNDCCNKVYDDPNTPLDFCNIRHHVDDFIISTNSKKGGNHPIIKLIKLKFQIGSIDILHFESNSRIKFLGHKYYYKTINGKSYLSIDNDSIPKLKPIDIQLAKNFQEDMFKKHNPERAKQLVEKEFYQIGKSIVGLLSYMRNHIPLITHQFMINNFSRIQIFEIPDLININETISKIQKTKDLTHHIPRSLAFVIFNEPTIYLHIFVDASLKFGNPVKSSIYFISPNDFVSFGKSDKRFDSSINSKETVKLEKLNATMIYSESKKIKYPCCSSFTAELLALYECLLNTQKFTGYLATRKQLVRVKVYTDNKPLHYIISSNTLINSCNSNMQALIKNQLQSLYDKFNLTDDKEIKFSNKNIKIEENDVTKNTTSSDIDIPSNKNVSTKVVKNIIDIKNLQEQFNINIRWISTTFNYADVGTKETAKPIRVRLTDSLSTNTISLPS